MEGIRCYAIMKKMQNSVPRLKNPKKRPESTTFCFFALPSFAVIVIHDTNKRKE